ncbi:hypothetical protein OAE61_02770 [Verrucomicrobiales bacterium]|nr:hypothetical protein [Verrucomicrobiales bacterium]
MPDGRCSDHQLRHDPVPFGQHLPMREALTVSFLPQVVQTSERFG